MVLFHSRLKKKVAKAANPWHADRASIPPADGLTANHFYLLSLHSDETFHWKSSRHTLGATMIFLAHH
jgi:hypothetical protein